MAAKSKHRSYVAFFPESSVNTPPADWAASGLPIEHTALDVSTIKAARLDDPTLETRILAKNKRHKIAGIRNTDAKLTLKCHGKATTTALDAQAAETTLSKILKHCMGGCVRTNTTTITGGTASQPIVDDTTNLVVGATIWVQDITSPAAKYSGKPRMTRIIAIDDGTKTLTVKPELPFTPANTDKVLGTITLYVDEDVLEDSVASAGGPHTASWFFKKHKTNTDLLWQLTGSVASFSLSNLGPGQLPTFELSIMAANQKSGAADGLSSPDFDDPYGAAQICLGKDSECVIASYSTDDHTVRQTSAFALDVGYTRDRITANSITADGFEGTSTYGLEPGDTSATITLNDYVDDWYASREADGEWYVMLSQPAAEGKAWGLMLPRCGITDHPSPIEVGSIHGVSVKFGAMVPDDCTGGTESLVKSPFLISLC